MHRHSLSKQGTFSATEFSCTPAQLAGSLPVPQLGQKALYTLPTRYCSVHIHYIQ